MIIFSVALTYSPMESLFGHLRDKQDLGNAFAAASLAGIFYKFTGECLIFMIITLSSSVCFSRTSGHGCCCSGWVWHCGCGSCIKTW